MALTGAPATLTLTADGQLTIGGETRALADVSALAITGTGGDDILLLDLAIPLTIPVSFDGGDGSDTLVGPASDVTWAITGPDTGTVAGVAFSAVENLTGSPDNQDTFDLAAGGSLSGLIDGGAGGFDSLVVSGTTVVSNPTDAHSGSLILDGNTIRYTGLEPVDISAANVVFNGADIGGNTETLDKDLIKVGPGSSGTIQILDRDPTDTTDLAEAHTFTIAGTSSLTINGGLGTDTVEFTGDYLVPNSSLTVNAEHIKVDPGVTINVGTSSGNDITFNAVYKDNGLSLLGITTTIPVIGVDGLVDISPDKGEWSSGSDYSQGDVVVDTTDGSQYRATSNISSDPTAPSADGANWSLAGSAQLIGHTISLSAFAGTLSTTVKGGSQDLTGGNLIAASVAGFDDSGSFTVDVSGTPTSCTYGGRNTTSNTFTTVSGCTGTPADGAVVRKDITENGSGSGINHAGLDLEYHANVNVHGSSQISATANVTLSSTVDVTATANAAAGPDKGDWVSGTNYTKGDVVTDTFDSKRYAATKDITPSTTAPHSDSGVLGAWTEATSHDSSIAATFVLASGKSQLSGKSSISTPTGDVSITSSVKTKVSSAADSSASGSGAGIAVVVFVTDSEAYIDSNADMPINAKSLTITAETDNDAPTTAKSSPKGSNGNDTSANSPTQDASTTVSGAGQSLPGTLTVTSTAGFADSGTLTIADPGVTGTCSYTGRTETTFTGITGCSGTPADGAAVTGASKQTVAADGKADNQSKTSDGNQDLSAALAVTVLVSTTQAYISPTDGSTAHLISTAGGTDKIQSHSKNNASATADAGNVKFSPDAPTFTGAATTGGFLNGSTTYYYRVTATFAAGESLPGPEATYAVPSGTNTNKITLNWVAVDGATGYKIYRSTESGKELLLGTVGAVTTYADDTNTAPSGAMPTGDTASSGIGIAVAVNVVVVNTKAWLAHNVSLAAGSLMVEALPCSTPCTDGSTFAAHATSGAGGSDVGVAGSIAVNIVVADTTADVEGTTADPIQLNGADLTLTATSKLDNTATADAKQASDGSTTGIGASFALNVVNDTTAAGLPDGSRLDGTKDLTVTSTGTDTTTTIADGGAASDGSLALSAQVAISVSNVTTSASIGSGPDLTLTGKLTAQATQTAAVTTKANGSTKGGTAGIGLSLALAVANHNVDSQLKRNLSAGGDVSFSADGSSTNDTEAVASSAGSQEKSGTGAEDKDSTGKDVNGKADGNLALANNASMSSANKGSGTSTTPEAKSGEGGGTKVTVAAAAAITIVTVSILAAIMAGLAVVTTGSVTLTTKGNGDSRTTSSGKGVKATTANIGAAVSINKISFDNRAQVGTDARIDAHGLTLSATMRTTSGADGKHVLDTEATAGAGGGKVGVAGSLALTIADFMTSALVLSNAGRSPPKGDLHGGNLSLTATSSVDSTAKAMAKSADSTTLGIGAGAAINIVDDTTTASIADGAEIIGANDVGLTATGTDAMTTYAEAGAAGAAGSTLALTADAAISLPTVITTASIGKASIGNTTQTLTTTGAVSASATQTASTKTTAKADAGGSDVTIGLALALAVVDDEVVATTNRDIHADGAVSFSAFGSSANDTQAVASAKGAEGKKDGTQGSTDSSNKDVNGKADDQLKGANDTRTAETGKGAKTSSTPKAKSGEGGGSSVTVAGAVAINVVGTTSSATIADGLAITSGGVLTLASQANTDSSTKADGKQVGTAGLTLGVGVAVAVNKATVLNEAVVGSQVTLDTHGLTLSATMRDVSGDQKHVFLADTIAGAGGGKVGIAGSLALTIADVSTNAEIKANATAPAAILHGGPLSMTATSGVTSTANAKAKDEASGTVGIGAGVAINIVNDTATASIDSGAAFDAGASTRPGAVSLTATDTNAMTTYAEAGTDGAAGSDAAITPDVAISYPTVTTSATIAGDNTQTLVAAGAVTLTATQDASALTTAKASAGGADVSIGLALALAIVGDSVTATIARNVTAGGAVSLTANGSSDNESYSEASAKGAKTQTDDHSTKDVNGKADEQLGNANTERKDNTGKDASTTSTPKAATGDKGGSSSTSVQVAAAVTINVITTVSLAQLAGTVTINAQGVASLKTQAATIADAIAKGETVGTGSSDGIGVGVAINLVDITNKATTGSATITGTGLDVEATMADKNNGLVRRWDATAKAWVLIDRGATLPVAPSSGDYYQLTQASAGTTMVDGGSQDVTSPTELKVKSTASFAPTGTFTADGITGTCTYTGKTATKFTGLSGCTGTPADKATVVSTTGTTVHTADQALDAGHTTLTVTSTANFAPTGSFTIDGIDGVCAYTGKTATTFTGVTGCTGAPADGAAITLIAFLPGIYKYDGTNWVLQTGTIGHGTAFPATPSGGDLFRMAEHEIVAEADAGAGKTDVGIAGAVAINIITNDKTQALVGAGSHVTATSPTADVTLKAQSNELDLAKADTQAEDAKSVGVGAAVALNILTSTETRAEAEDTSTLTGGRNVDVEALSRWQAETEVVSGASGDDTTVAPGVALLLITSEHTTARLGTSAVNLVAAGTVTVKAVHEGEVSTVAKAVAKGSTAVGASIALNVVLDWKTLAEVARSAQGTAVDITANSSMASAATADATATGADKSDSDADKKKQDQVDNNPNTNTKGAGTLPKASDNSTGTGKANSTTGEQGGDSNSGGVGVAASISLNWVVISNIASIAQGVHVTATSGHVQVSAENSTDAAAKATGLSYSVDGSHIAAAVGVNVANITNDATVGQDAVVTGHGITIEAVNTSGNENDFVVWGLSAAGGASQDKGGASVAASIGVQVVSFHTQASVAKGAHLTSEGEVEVIASNKIGVQNLAFSGSFSAGGAAIGGAISVNVFPDVTTEAFIDSDTGSHVTNVDALEGITVSATSSLQEAPGANLPLVSPYFTLPPVTSVAMAGGISSGGAAVSGSVIVDVLFLTTKAYISNGAQLNQHPDGAWTPGSSQTVDVTATDHTHLTNLAGTLALSSSGAGVGIGIVVEVIFKHVEATIAGSATKVSAQGNISVAATSTEDFFMAAVDVGGSSSSAAVDGSIIVVVFNPTDDLAHAVAAASIGGTIHAGGSLGVTASDTVTGTMLAGGLAISTSSAGVAISVVVIDRNGRVDAGVGSGSDVEANGGTGLTVSATQHVTFTLLAMGGAGGDSAAVAGSVVVDVMSDTTLAHVDPTVTIGHGSTTGVAVAASDTTKILALAGTLAIGGSAGVGVGVDVEVLTKDTEASIGNGGTINTTGNVTTDATSSETVTSISVGGSFSGTAAVTVNAAVSAYNVTTKAFIADGTTPSNGAKVFADGSVRVAADEKLELNVIAGNISGGGSAAVGAAVAVPVVTKQTHAWIGNDAQVNAKGLGTPLDVVTGSYVVAAVDTRFNPATAISGSTINLGYDHGFKDGQEVRYDDGNVSSPPDPLITPINGLVDGGLYYVKVMNATSVQLYSDPGLTNLIAVSGGTGESHRLVPTNQAGVTKDGANRFNPNTPGAVDLGANTIKLPYTLTVSNDDAVVYSSGGGTPIGGLVDGQTYYYQDAGGGRFSLLNKKASDGGTPVDLTSLPTDGGRSHSIVPGGKTPSADAGAIGPRQITATTSTFSGVAVTASNSDDLGSFGVGLGFSGAAAVTLAGSVNVDTVHTSAHIGSSAKVNCGATCADNVTGAGPSQSVRVAAENQFYELGIALTIAIGGSFGVSIPVAVRVATLDTNAYVGSGTSLNARQDVSVTANGKETVVSVAVGAGGGTVGVAGTVAVTVLNVHTYACTGSPASFGAYDCTSGGATINAGGNVLVGAADTTKLVLVTIALAGGYVGVGAAVGVATLTKETEAYLGAGSVVTALGTGAGLAGIYDGTLTGSTFGTHTAPIFHGLAVQAYSSEDVFGLVPAIGGGFVGVAGGVGVTIINVTTKAFAGPSSKINCAATCANLVAGAGGPQSVNVSAVDAFKSLTVAGGAAGGFVGVAGGVDIGVADSSVQAYLGAGSYVRAALDVEVNSVSRKDVQTYALSIGGGAVGVAASVSVWTVGTKTTSTYHDSDGGPDRGTWSSATATSADSNVYYHKGDVVTYNGARYSAKQDQPLGAPDAGVSTTVNGAGQNVGSGSLTVASTAGFASSGTFTGVGIDGTCTYTSTNATQFLGVSHCSGTPADAASIIFSEWQGASDALQGNSGSVGAADSAAGGGGGGYTSVFTGTTAAAPTPWAPGPYNKGAIVTDLGHTYHANNNIVDTATHPQQNTAEWTNADSESAVNTRISNASAGPQSSINTAAAGVGGGVASSAISTVPSAGTTATVDGTVVAGGHVHVWATDNLAVFGIAGAAAGGIVGVGASVLVLNVKSITDAGVGPSASISAGGAVGVSAGMAEQSTGIAFSGALGFVAVGAQVAVLNDSGTQNAHIDGGASVPQAGGGLTVSVTANRDVHTYAIGVGLGAGAIGAAVGTVNVSGDASATIGNVAVGATGTVSGITVSAVDHITSDILVISVQGGVGLGLSAALAFVDLSGTTKASSGAHGPVGAGGLSVTADGTHTATANTVNVSSGALAVGVTIARVNNGRSTEAGLTPSSNVVFSTPSPATVKATASNSADAEAPGGSGGGVSITVLLAFAVLSGHTTTTVDGSVSNATDITISAIADNTATANTFVIGVSVIGLSGAVATATIGQGANIVTTVGSTSTLAGSGAVTVEAKTRGTGNLATATAEGGSGGVLFAGVLFIGVATVEGSVQAHLNGKVTSGVSLDVNANALNDAEAHVLAGSVSLGGALAGSLGFATVSGAAHVTADAASTAQITIGGASTIEATGTNIANSSSQVISFGLVSLGVSVPSATIGASTTAGYDGVVTGGSGLTVHATGYDTATVDSKPIAIGLIAGNGAAASAEITKDAQVNAGVGKEAVLTLGSATVKVQATVANSATATLNSEAFGGLAVSIMFAEAYDRGGSHASFDGELVSASELKVQTDVSRGVESHMFVLAIALAASAASADSTAIIGDKPESREQASLDGDTKIHSSGTAITVRATRSASAFSEANGGAGGLLGSGALMLATSKVQGSVQAYGAANATIGTSAGKPGSLQVTSEDNSTAVANATVGSGALGFTAGGSVTDAEVTPTVEAYLGSSVKVALSDGLGHNLIITANSNNAEADSTAKSFGGALGLHIGAPLATGKSQPVVRAYIGSGSTIVVGGTVTVDAESNANGSGVQLTEYITGLTADGAGTSTTDNSVTFTSHGLITGDVVLYHANGGGIVTGLHDNHDYGVIVVDKNTLRFGATFNGAAANADSVAGSIQGIDASRSMVRFASAHNFETGDAVIYRTSGTSISSAFVDGQVLYVRVIDATTIELYTTYAAATSPAFTFTTGWVTGNQIANSDTVNYSEGARVTYKAGTPLFFAAKSVDINSDGSGGISGDNGGAYDIFLGYRNPPDSGFVTGHGLVEGERVTYQVSDPGQHVTNLADGGIYYVHVVDAWTIQLALTYCEAVGYSFDNSCTTGPNPSDHIARNPIHLGRPSDNAVTHAIRPAPISGLTDGYTYQVHRVNGGAITLRDVGSASDKTLGTGVLVGGQQLFAAGAALQTATGCGTPPGPCSQQLYLRLTGALGAGETLKATDDTSLRTASPPSGDGQTSASAVGGGGAAIDVSEPTAKVYIDPTVKAYVAAMSATIGGDLWITSSVATNSSAYSENGSGGLVSIPSVHSEINGTDNNTSFIGADFGGSGIAGDLSSPQVDATGVSLTVTGNVKLEATTRLTSSVDAKSDSGGGFDASSAYAHTTFTDNTATVIGKNAVVTGSTVKLNATTGNTAGENNHAHARSFVLALFGSSSASPAVTINSHDTAILDGDSGSSGVVTGLNGVDVRAHHENVAYGADGGHTCICLDFHFGSDGSTNVTLSDTASGHQGVTVVAGPRIILGVTTNDPLWATPLDTSTGDPALALYVQAEQTGSADTRHRAIHWNSDVVINSGPSPLLIIGPDGKVVTSVNITANGVVNPAPGNALGAHPYVEVNDLVNHMTGDVWMQSSGGAIDGGSLVTPALLGHVHVPRQLEDGHDPQPVRSQPGDRQHRRHQPDGPAEGGGERSEWFSGRDVRDRAPGRPDPGHHHQQLPAGQRQRPGPADQRHDREPDRRDRHHEPVRPDLVVDCPRRLQQHVQRPAHQPRADEHPAPGRGHEHRRAKPVPQRRPGHLGRPPRGLHDLVGHQPVHRPADAAARLHACRSLGVARGPGDPDRPHGGHGQHLRPAAPDDLPVGLAAGPGYPGREPERSRPAEPALLRDLLSPRWDVLLLPDRLPDAAPGAGRVRDRHGRSRGTEHLRLQPARCRHGRADG